MKALYSLSVFTAALLAITQLSAQVCTSDNHALDFDGNGDFIDLSPINGLAPTSDFTAEAWFFSRATTGVGQPCPSNFRRLLSFGDVASGTRLELGECGGLLNLLWAQSGSTCPNALTIPITTPSMPTGIDVRDGKCHHIAWIRQGTTVEIYYDGVSVYLNNSLTCLPPVTYFRAGHWPGGTTGTQEWQGLIDEIRLWDHARTPAQIAQYQYCLLNGQEPGLVAYWQLDQGVAGGPNNSPPITKAIDASPNGNDGMLFNFALTGTVSNFVQSCAPSVYPNYNNLDVVIQDLKWSVALIAICEGDPIHISLQCNGQPVPPAGGNVAVNWEYKDGKLGPWFGLGPANGFPNGFSFLVPQVTANCANGISHVDRYYRAQIVVDDGLGHTCTYTTREAQLQICCPITGNLTVTPSQPAPLCEGDQVTYVVQLTTNMPVPDPNNNNVHISWCVIDGNNPPQPLPGFDDMLGFTYPVSGTHTAMAPSLCFKAVISNCACPPLTLTECVKVDAKPVCNATIQALSSNLTLLSSTPWLTYEICPGEPAQLQYVGSFQNCKPSWQYSFDMVTWFDMGATNPIQNTNIVPTNWGANTSIFYQIQCKPLTNPSGCPPCISNTIEIKLKPPPTAPVLPASATICYGTSYPMNIGSQTQPGVTYTWYCNGQNIGSATFVSFKNPGCYWVEANDGCQKVFSNKFCLTVCLVTAKISCPLDPNPCACPGDPIYLTSLSTNSCGNPLDCVWSWTDSNGVPQTYTGCNLTDIPDHLNGTTYTLTVTDPITGCTGTDIKMIKPCH
ncbi:MAG: LamG domain-containing protein [Lewinellaceae bacterium]|nr:LamG domain-containing protein [Saprospiraceae bacterium]MCB9334234.1 LamG domain-containing protein [Lewinellaceae bacterium]